ncbi:serine/threonine protein kinase, partial [Mycobacterium sp. E796]|uniref:serine/threonine protein kinase n=1 Tax=Mycobacterium sp. E796 TaxID=1834151 RepID=UPI000B032A7C
MAEPMDSEDVGTQAPDVQTGSQAISEAESRPQATQALFRPDFDDDDDDDFLIPGIDIDAPERMTVATRVLPPTRQLGGGLVEIPRVR